MITLIVIGSTKVLGIVTYYYMYPATLPGEKQPVISTEGTFYHPWQTGCDNTAAIKLKQ